MRYLLILFLLLAACDGDKAKPAEAVDAPGDVSAVDAPDAVTIN